VTTTTRLASSSSTAPSSDQLSTLTTWSDRVTVVGMRFWGRHGVLPQETALGQRFDVDATVFLDLAPAAASDAVGDTVDYGAVHAIARRVVEGPPRALIEGVAGEIAAGVLAAFPAAAGVWVAVRKPGAPVAGAVFDHCGAEVRRQRR
jgi:dihydroneopterin aldolase